MLPATNRLRRSADFRRAVRQGRRRASSTLVVHHLDDNETDRALVGIAVARSVGSAVVRNRVKRRLRHLMRQHLGQLSHGLTVIRATNQAAAVTTPILGADLTACLSSLEALRS